MELYEINNYNFKEVKNSVLNHFNNYRFYKNRINLIEARIKCALNSDNLGIFSNKKNDPTFNKVEQIEKFRNYIKIFDETIDKLKDYLTDDEKTIFDLSIIDRCSDEELAYELSINKQHLYKPKKSCYIKTAEFYNLVS